MPTVDANYFWYIYSQPETVYDTRMVDSLQNWNAVYTPMVPVTVQGLPGSAAGGVNYSPMAFKYTMGNEAVWERGQLRRALMDPKRQYNARKAVMYDYTKLMRRKYDERFQYIAPGTPEAKYVEEMFRAQRDPTSGVEPLGISFLYDRM